MVEAVSSPDVTMLTGFLREPVSLLLSHSVRAGDERLSFS